MDHHERNQEIELEIQKNRQFLADEKDKAWRGFWLLMLVAVPAMVFAFLWKQGFI